MEPETETESETESQVVNIQKVNNCMCPKCKSNCPRCRTVGCGMCHMCRRRGCSKCPQCANMWNRSLLPFNLSLNRIILILILILVAYIALKHYRR
jgi:hypothetical protein